MVKRLSVALLACILFMALATPAFAQEPRFCSDLAEEDCALLYESTETMSQVYSGNTTNEVSILAQNLPEVPYPDLAFNLIQETSFDTTEAAATALADLQEMEPAQFAELMDNSEEFAAVIVEIFNGTSTEIRAAVSFSADLAQLIETQTQAPWPQDVLLHLVLKNGVLYIDLDALAETVPEADMIGSGWVGLEMTPLIEQSLMEQPTTAVPMPGATDGTTMTVSPASLNMGTVGNRAGPFFSQLAPLDPQGTVLQYLNVERLPAEEASFSGIEPVEGEEVAVFRTTFDFQSFVASPLFEQLVAQAIASQQGSPPSEAELSQIVGIARLAAPLVLNSVTLELLEAVGVDTAYLYGANFLFAIDLTQLLSLAELAGDALPPIELQTEGPSRISLEVLQTASDFDADIEIQAPEEATLLTAEQITMLLEQAN
jgi:hypothetical protein